MKYGSIEADAWATCPMPGPPVATGITYAAAYSTVTNQVSSGITPAPAYDANGNQKTSTGATLAWNALNQPITINSTSATYDALGRMVEIGSGSTYKQFVFRPSGALLAVYSSGLVKGTVPLPGGGAAIYNASGLNYLRHKDWLGSSRFATTWAHAVYSKEAYAPFGETYNEAGTADRSFTGQDQDVVTGSAGSGVYDFLFRKYDPSAGRWLSPDPSGWQAVSLGAPQSLNRYSYVQNNPMSLTDPYGLDCAYQFDNGYVSVSQGECPTDANGNPTDNGFYIDASGVTGASFDANGDINGYSIGYQLYNMDGTLFTPPVTTFIGYGFGHAITDVPTVIGVTFGDIPMINGAAALTGGVLFSPSNPSASFSATSLYFKVNCVKSPISPDLSKHGCEYLCAGAEEWLPGFDVPTLATMNFTAKQIYEGCGSMGQMLCPASMTVEGNYIPGSIFDVALNPYISNCK